MWRIRSLEKTYRFVINLRFLISTFFDYHLVDPWSCIKICNNWDVNLNSLDYAYNGGENQKLGNKAIVHGGIYLDNRDHLTYLPLRFNKSQDLHIKFHDSVRIMFHIISVIEGYYVTGNFHFHF